MSQNGKRWKWCAADKLRIVLAGMQPGFKVSDLCRRERLNPVVYYDWKPQLLDSASGVFEDRKVKPNDRRERLEAKNAGVKNVIAEITAENLELRTRRSDWKTMDSSCLNSGSGSTRKSSRRRSAAAGQ
jgi:transposase-like protein